MAEGRTHVSADRAALGAASLRLARNRGIELVRAKSVIGSFAKAVGAVTVIGGGQIVRQNASLASLILLLLRCVFARLTGGRIVAIGLGVSRLAPGARVVIWRLILALADRIVLRDQASLDNLGLIMRRQNRLVLGNDLVDEAPEIFDQFTAGQVDRTGGLLIAPCSDRSEDRDLYCPAFVDLMEALGPRPFGTQIAFALHDPKPGMDGAAAARIESKLGLTDVLQISPEDPGRFIATYARAQLVLTNRLHSAIFALHTGTPVIVFADSDKLRGLAQGGAVAACDPLEHLSHQQVRGLVDTALALAPGSVSTHLQANKGANRAALVEVIQPD